MGGDGFVDLRQRELVGDESVESHFVGADEVDEAGDFEIGRNAAAVGAFKDFFEMEGEGIDGSLLSGAGDSDEDGAAVGVGQVISEFDDSGISCGVDDNVGAGFSHD